MYFIFHREHVFGDRSQNVLFSADNMVKANKYSVMHNLSVSPKHLAQFTSNLIWCTVWSVQFPTLIALQLMDMSLAFLPALLAEVQVVKMQREIAQSYFADHTSHALTACSPFHLSCLRRMQVQCLCHSIRVPLMIPQVTQNLGPCSIWVREEISGWLVGVNKNLFHGLLSCVCSLESVREALFILLSCFIFCWALSVGARSNFCDV